MYTVESKRPDLDRSGPSVAWSVEQECRLRQSRPERYEGDGGDIAEVRSFPGVNTSGTCLIRTMLGGEHVVMRR